MRDLILVKKEEEKAFALAEKMQSIWPGSMLATVTLAHSFNKSGDPQAALGAFSKGIALDVAEPLNYWRRSSVHTKTGQFDFALQDANAGLLVKPQSVQGQFAKAKALVGLGQYEKALPALNFAVAFGQRDYHYRERGLLYQEMNQIESAASDFEKAYELDPEDNNNVANLARARFQQNRVAEALNLQKAYLDKQPDQPEAQVQYGIYLMANGALKSGLSQINKALPNCSGELSDALKDYRFLLKQKPELQKKSQVMDTLYALMAQSKQN
ncbi:MAG: tetratricopeptide repeat protein [Acidobacteria bacterium]|nr:tetratricopeptide repeat protein [Acidobacteriota bacterium]